MYLAQQFYRASRAMVREIPESGREVTLKLRLCVVNQRLHDAKMEFFRAQVLNRPNEEACVFRLCELIDRKDQLMSALYRETYE